MNTNNEHPKSIDDATPAEWDALHKQMEKDEDNLTPSQRAQLDSVCFECG